MAKTSYVEIPSGYETIYAKSLSSSDRFINVSVRRKVLFSSRRRKKGLTQKSLIALLTPVWNGFSGATRTAWTSAGAVSGMTGFKAFVKDTGLRIANSIGGYATPSDIYQALVGRMHVESPATGLKIEQLHPTSYYVYKKVTGTKSQYNPVPVTEFFSLPVTLTLSYKTVLTSLGAGSFARARLTVFSSFQSRTIETHLTLNFGLSDSWQVATATLSSVLGEPRGYTATIEIFNCSGDLYFDNVSFFHNGFNWCRDPQCNDINQSFTRAFYQIPKNWAVETIETGAQFESMYYN